MINHPPEKFGSMDLATTRALLIRFQAKSENILPEGLRSIERKDEQELIKKLQGEGGRQKGHMFMNNVPRLQIALLRAGLANHRFALADAHRFYNEHTGYHVGVLGFRRLTPGESRVILTPDVKEGLRSLATENVWGGRGYVNPNGVNTVELNARQQGAPNYSMVVRNGRLVVLPTERKLGEDEENAVIADELLAELVDLRQLIG